ncbi:MAG: tetratricopeptide repeat protein [Polyangiaceae bacterium]|nr:tetratricopeptide repeat protein [Polyangiaceae bacterium]
MHNLSIAYYYRGDLKTAVEHDAEAARVCRELGSAARTAELLVNLAVLEIQRGRLDEAERALAGTSQELTPAYRAMARLLGARVAALRGDVSKARSEYAAAILMVRDAQDERSLAWGKAFFAELALDEGKLDEAEALAKESLGTRSRLGLTLFTGESQLLLARILLAKGDFDEAEKEAKAALDTFIAEQSVALEADARAVIAQIQLTTKRLEDAATTLAKARQTAATTQFVAPRLEVMITGAILDARQGKTEDAHKALDSVIADATKLGIPRFELEGRIAKARIDMGANKTAQGRAALAAAAKDAEKLGLHGITRKAQP